MASGVRRVVTTSCVVGTAVVVALTPSAASAGPGATRAPGHSRSPAAVTLPAPSALLDMSGARQAATLAATTPRPTAFAHLTAHLTVTHGTAVPAPSRAVPWAVSLWNEAPTSDGLRGSGTLHFLCSATAINGRLLVTAAHCTKKPGFLYARVGVDTFSADVGGFVPVEAIRAHSGYHDAQNRNDIAMLRPLFDLGLRSYATLATPGIAKAVRAGKKALTIYGWGDTETGKLTGALRVTAVQQQQVAAAKAFGGVFVPTRMIAAGHYNPVTKRYAGGCSGDSGGPLTTRIAGVTYLVGVTNFGAASACDKTPTVFASVGDYTAWESQSKAVLPGLARSHNTALPVAMSVPTVAGTVALGQTLTCTSGAWSANATDVASLWFRGSDSLGAGADHVIAVEDAGQSLVCVSVARSQAGFDAVAVPTPLAVPALPTATGAAAIGGVAFDVMPVVDSVATCGGVSPSSPDTTTTYDWLNASGYDGRDGVVIQTGQTLVFSAATLDALAGRFLICRATTSNTMGSVVTTTYAAIPGRDPVVAPSPAAS